MRKKERLYPTVMALSLIAALIGCYWVGVWGLSNQTQLLAFMACILVFGLAATCHGTPMEGFSVCLFAAGVAVFCASTVSVYQQPTAETGILLENGRYKPLVILIPGFTDRHERVDKVVNVQAVSKNGDLWSAVFYYVPTEDQAMEIWRGGEIGTASLRLRNEADRWLGKIEADLPALPDGVLTAEYDVAGLQPPPFPGLKLESLKGSKEKK